MVVTVGACSAFIVAALRLNVCIATSAQPRSWSYRGFLRIELDIESQHYLPTFGQENLEADQDKPHH